MLFQLDRETTSHYILRCHDISSARSVLMNDLILTDPSISKLNETALANVLLYSDSKKSTSQNSTIKYVFATKRFAPMCAKSLNVKR